MSSIVSTFPSLLSSHQVTKSLAEVFHQMRTDEDLRFKTQLHRSGVGQKQKMPVFVPSAILDGGRKTEQVQQLTGLLYFDYDHLSEWEMEMLPQLLAANTFVVGFHRSLGGSGLHVIVSYEVFYYDMQPMPLSELDFRDPRRSQRSRLLWNAIWEDVRRQFEDFVSKAFRNLHVDTQCKDVARPSVMVYDPEAKLYEDSYHPYTVILSKALLDYEGSKPHVATGNPIGRPAKTQITRAFDAAEAFAKSQGVEPQHGTLNRFLSMVIYEVNRYGIEQDEALAEAKDRYYYYGDGSRGITSVVRSIYDTKQAEHGTLRLPGKTKSTDSHKSKRATVADIEGFLLSQGEYRKNVISHRLEVRWHADSPMLQYQQRSMEAFSLNAANQQIDNTFHELHDSDISTLIRLQFEETGLTINTAAEVYNVLQSDTCSAPYNPILYYLKPLQGLWQPGDHDYLQDLIHTVEIEGGDETRAMLDDFFVRWFVGMVHGWINASSTHGTILTFIGKQGIGKSSWMRMLLPPELRGFYKEQLRFRNLEKDDRIQLAECCLINLEEIDAMSETDANQLKALVTLDAIRERLPYDKTPRTMPRLATFCATGNRSDFLTDPTGNRRWLTFTVSHFTINPFTYLPDYAHIYAQALYLAVHEPTRFVMSQHDIHHLDKHNEQYVSQSAEVELCSLYVHPAEVGQDGKPLGDSKWMTASEVAQRLNYYNPHVRLSIRSVGQTLTQKGYPTRIRRGIRQYLICLD